MRCAAVFALGTFVGNSAERTDHSTTIDHNVAMMLAQLINDGSPVVRKVGAPPPQPATLGRSRGLSVPWHAPWPERTLLSSLQSAFLHQILMFASLKGV